MTQPAKSQEPSMEEILASIRRIIADDDATKSVQRNAEPPRNEPQPAPSMAPRPQIQPEPRPAAYANPALADDGALDQSSDILDLTESMAAPAQPAAADFGSSAKSHSTAADPVPQFRTIEATPDVGFDEAAEQPPAMPPREEPSRLLSSTTSAAVDSAFTALAQTVLVQNARTLEDLVREMLRPMLKNWLDDNLPGMVERLVRAEIERVSRGRTG